MAKALKKLTGRFSNTWVGASNTRGEFIHELDENGRWIRSNNLRVVVAGMKAVMPAIISSARIAKLAKARADLNLTPGVDYSLQSQFDLKEDKDKSLVASTGAIYRPLQPECTI